ncbi:hypothetical protein BN3658_01837 [Coriobacteriaceae bacterium CHKCI002]|nr:hypothetical protein BN3658_01837 [Coriobacteriaceae bacterium CHKCI002]
MTANVQNSACVNASTAVTNTSETAETTPCHEGVRADTKNAMTTTRNAGMNRRLRWIFTRLTSTACESATSTATTPNVPAAASIAPENW